MLNFIINHFSHVFPILSVGVFGLIIVIERFRALVWEYPMELLEPFYEKIRNLVSRDAISEAVVFCERFYRKPVAQIVKEGLLRAHQPDSIIEHGLQIAVGKALQKIQAKTPFLATIANVATLLGLFGTILGLIQSFEAVGSANAQERSALLAAGISTAMNATMLGLAVAIPCMIAYSFLMSKTNKISAEIDQAAIRILDILHQRYYSESSSQRQGSLDQHGSDELTQSMIRRAS